MPKSPEAGPALPPINTNKPSFVPAQAIVGLGTLGITNVGTAQSGGSEVTAIAAFLNLVAQFIKMPEHFNQNRWLIPILLILGILAAYFVLHDFSKAFLDGSLAALQSVVNYRAYNATGLGGMPPATYLGSTQEK
jgi:hypothetical protein